MRIRKFKFVCKVQIVLCNTKRTRIIKEAKRRACHLRLYGLIMTSIVHYITTIRLDSQQSRNLRNCYVQLVFHTHENTNGIVCFISSKSFQPSTVWVSGVFVAYSSFSRLFRPAFCLVCIRLHLISMMRGASLWSTRSDVCAAIQFERITAEMCNCNKKDIKDGESAFDS